MTLPTEYLERAETIARAEHITLSAVIAKALAQGLSESSKPARLTRGSNEWLEGYRKCFEIPGFSEEELLVLEGIVMEPIGPDNPDPITAGSQGK